MERIDVSKLLKDCPSGMKLDSTMYENIVFDKIIEDDEKFPIRVIISDGLRMNLTKYGQYSDIGSAKCIIFPEGKNTWEGFHRPFKDGDIVMSGIYFDRENYADEVELHLGNYEIEVRDGKTYAVYKNQETKISKPIFKIGDKIKHKDTVLTIINVKTNSYIVEDEPDNFGLLMFSQQDKWELINKPNFKVGDTIKKKGLDILKPIEDRAKDFPNMTSCD